MPACPARTVARVQTALVDIFANALLATQDSSVKQVSSNTVYFDSTMLLLMMTKQ